MNQDDRKTKIQLFRIFRDLTEEQKNKLLNSESLVQVGKVGDDRFGCIEELKFECDELGKIYLVKKSKLFINKEQKENNE